MFVLQPEKPRTVSDRRLDPKTASVAGFQPEGGFDRTPSLPKARRLYRLIVVVVNQQPDVVPLVRSFAGSFISGIEIAPLNNQPLARQRGNSFDGLARHRAPQRQSHHRAAEPATGGAIDRSACGSAGKRGAASERIVAKAAVGTGGAIVCW